jgi:hypothetical protein
MLQCPLIFGNINLLKLAETRYNRRSAARYNKRRDERDTNNEQHAKNYGD